MRTKYPYDDKRQNEVRLLVQELETKQPRANSRSAIFRPGTQWYQREMALHYRALLIKAGHSWGKSQGNADKYPRYLLDITGPGGLVSKESFKTEQTYFDQAELICRKIAESKVGTNKNSANKLTGDYMSAYLAYCKLLELEKSGQLSATP